MVGNLTPASRWPFAGTLLCQWVPATCAEHCARELGLFLRCHSRTRPLGLRKLWLPRLHLQEPPGLSNVRFEICWLQPWLQLDLRGRSGAFPGTHVLHIASENMASQAATSLMAPRVQMPAGDRLHPRRWLEEPSES